MKQLTFFLSACLFFLVSYQSSYSCDRSELTLLGVVANGNTWDINLQFTVGAGITGALTGADGATADLGFALYMAPGCPPLVNSFTPSLLSDTMNTTLFGFLTGPLLGASEGVGYISPLGDPFTCVSSTAACGNVHTDTNLVTINMSVLPDSIRLFGIEGFGNPIAGCFPNADMVISLVGHPGTDCCPFDTTAPSLTCPSGIVRAFDSLTCAGIIPDLSSEVMTSDACAIPVVSQSPAAGSLTSGTTNVTVFSTDALNNTDSCLITVSFQDSTPPVLACTTGVIQLDSQGIGMVPLSLASTFTDNCSTLNLTTAPVSFGCADLGNQSVVLTLTDAGQNQVSCTTQVVVEDNLAPQAECLPGDTVYLDINGMATLNPMDYDGGSSDNCNLSSFIATPGVLNAVGLQAVVLTATDASGNVDTCQVNLTVLDTFAVGLDEGLASIWKVSPNPARDQIRVEASREVLEPVRIQLLDIRGQAVGVEAREVTEERPAWVLSIKDLAKGIYFVRVEGEQWTWTQKVLKW